MSATMYSALGAAKALGRGEKGDKGVQGATGATGEAWPQVWSVKVGAGTDYSLTGTMAAVAFGGGSEVNPSIAVTQTGDYYVTFAIEVSSPTIDDVIEAQLYNVTDAGIVAGTIVKQSTPTAGTYRLTFAGILTLTTGKTYSVYARNATSVDGVVTASGTILSMQYLGIIS